MPSAEIKRLSDFTHHLNDGGRFESVCRRCDTTVASDLQESVLKKAELFHFCWQRQQKGLTEVLRSLETTWPPVGDEGIENNSQ
jgi:hypothetical protein